MKHHTRPASEALLTPAEAAEVFQVRPSTVNRWANRGLIGSVRTLGGHHRYRETEVRALLEGQADPSHGGEPATVRAAYDQRHSGSLTWGEERGEGWWRCTPCHTVMRGLWDAHAAELEAKEHEEQCRWGERS